MDRSSRINQERPTDDWRSNKRFTTPVVGGFTFVGAAVGFVLAPFVHDRGPTVPDRFLNAGEAALLFVVVIGRLWNRKQ